MNTGNMSPTHLELLRHLSSAEIERLYLQSWIINARNTSVKDNPEFRNLFKYQFRRK